MKKQIVKGLGLNGQKVVNLTLSPEGADKVKHFAELGFLMSLISHMKVPPQNGRFRGKLESIHGLALRYFVGIPYAKQMYENPIIQRAIQQHIDFICSRTNWENKEKHIVTILTFCLEFVETSTFPYEEKMTKLLNDTVDYFDRVKEIDNKVYEEGLIGDNQWNSLIKIYKKEN